MGSREVWSEQFFQWGLRLLRDGSFPAFGIASAQALVAPEPTMQACMGTGLGLWAIILSLAVIAFAVSVALTADGPAE